MKNFIWYFYIPQQNNNDNLSFSDITRLFYLATNIGYDNQLKYNKSTYMNIDLLKQKLGLGEREFYILNKKLKENTLISINDNQYNLNSDMFYKGNIRPRIPFIKKNEKNFIKINTNEIKFLYENCADNRKHKILGLIFSLIPYCLGKDNIIMIGDREANWEDIANIIKYDSDNISKIKNKINQIKLSDNTDILIDNNQLRINPNLISNINDTQDNEIAIDLHDIQQDIINIKNKNKDENICIYLINIDNTNCYKIGCTADLVQRLICLQTSNPFKLNIVHSFVGGYKVEYYLHKIFDNYKIKNEWFELEENHIDLIKKLV